jgi:hypothetical protein
MTVTEQAGRPHRQPYLSYVDSSPLRVSSTGALALGYLGFSDQRSPVLAYNGQGRFLLSWLDRPSYEPTWDGSRPGEVAYVTRIAAPDRVLDGLGVVVADSAGRATVKYLGPPYPASVGGDFALFYQRSLETGERQTDLRTLSAETGAWGPEFVYARAFNLACSAGGQYFALGDDNYSDTLHMAVYAPDGTQRVSSASTPSAVAGSSLDDVGVRGCSCSASHCLAAFSRYLENTWLYRVDLSGEAGLDAGVPVEVEHSASGLKSAPSGDDFLLVYRLEGGYFFLRRWMSTSAVLSPARLLFQSADTQFEFWNDGTGFLLATWSLDGPLQVRRVSPEGEVGAPEVIADAEVEEAAFARATRGATLAVFTRKDQVADSPTFVRMYARWLLQPESSVPGDGPPPDAGSLPDAAHAGAADAGAMRPALADASVLPVAHEDGGAGGQHVAHDAGVHGDASTSPDGANDAGRPTVGQGSSPDAGVEARDAGQAMPATAAHTSHARSGCSVSPRPNRAVLMWLFALSLLSLGRRRRSALGR